MKNNPKRFWILVLFLGWAFDFLFWRKPVGINFFLFVILCLAAGIYLLWTDGLHLARRSALLLFLILFLSSITFLRQEPLTVFLSVSLSLFFMGVFALTYLNGYWTRYGLIDYLAGYLSLFGSMIARPLGFAAEVRGDQPSLSEKRSSPIWPIIRGIVIALPVIAIFAALLSSADPIFANRFEKFIGLFKIDNLPEYIFRLVYILILAYAIAGVYLHAAQKSSESVEEKTRFSSFLGNMESTIVLGSVVVLFAAFVIIQFQYFFGGQANINIEGYTYSEYARKGFGELVVVAFFSLLLLLGLGSITRRETETQRRIFSTLGAVLVGLVVVMLVSAYQRLVLYESAYGFSRLRTYTHVFMIWLALLLIVVVVLEITRHERSVGLAMVLASLGYVFSLGLLNVDAFIVKQNAQRELYGVANVASAQSGRVELDAQYFLGLSDDAVPALANAFENKAIPLSVHEKLGAALFCKRNEREQNTRAYPWQSFHISRVVADTVFVHLKNELDAYHVDETVRAISIKTPSGKNFLCYQSVYD